MKWTAELMTELARLWATGASGKCIAKKMGLASKNVAIGKAHRMGLPGRPHPIKRARPARPLEPPVGARVLGTIDPPDLLRPPVIRPGCQWIEGSPRADDSCKCGAPTAPKSSYCERHHGRAWRRPTFVDGTLGKLPQVTHSRRVGRT